MATRIAVANGNFTDAATWAEVDATSLLDAENASVNIGTAYQESQSFTPGAITIDGIAVKIAVRTATPSGTMSVRLAQAGSTVAGTEVTINIADIESRDGEQGWYFFKFAAPVTLLAATAYTVSVKATALNLVSCYRNATVTNWARMLRTTTTGAPAAGDNLFILGEWTAAGTKTDRTVTMNGTATTDYGSNGTSLASFGIGKGGTLTWGTSAATAYRNRWSGLLVVWRGGTLNTGTVVSPVPRDSSALLEFDCAADGDFGLVVYGTWVGQGLSRTLGKNVVRCLLNTDEAAASTVWGVDTDTGWKSGDEVAIASTSRTASQHEQRTLSIDATATELTVTSGLTNAHSGTSPTQAEVILLTRNVRVESVSSTAMAYVLIGAAATVDLDWVGFRYLGTVTSGKRGIELATVSGSVAMSYCCVRDFEQHGIYTLDNFNNVSIDHIVGYNLGANTTNHAAIRLAATTVVGASISVNDACLIPGGGNNSGAGIYCLNLQAVLEAIRVSSSSGYGVRIDAENENQAGSIGTLITHSNGNAGVAIDSAGMCRITSITSWRNSTGSGNGAGLQLGNCHQLHVGTLVCFGNLTRNIHAIATAKGRFILCNVTIAGDSSFATTLGFAHGSTSGVDVVIRGGSFGVASGIFVAHTSADIDLGGATSHRQYRWLLNEVVLASTTEFLNKSAGKGDSFVAFQRADGSTGVHRIERLAIGTTSRELTTFRTTAPSLKMEPTAAYASNRLESVGSDGRGWIVPVASGGSRTAGVYVRKDSTYNGQQPRLMVRANPALGLDADTQLDVMSGGADQWELLSGTPSPAAEEAGAYEFYVDVTGTAGAVYVDDPSFT